MTTPETAVRIDLDPYIAPNRVLSGPDWGRKVREQTRLDDLDAGPGPVVIGIPEYVISVNSSFLRGLIRPSIMRLGAQGFRDKYGFEPLDFAEDIEDEIRRTLIHMQRVASEERAAA